MFHLDFFNFTTWHNTNDLSKDKIKGALIVKNATKSPIDMTSQMTKSSIGDECSTEDYFLHSLKEFVPKTITIAFEEDFDELEIIRFPFIKDEPSEKLCGVKISEDIKWDDEHDS